MSHFLRLPRSGLLAGLVLLSSVSPVNAQLIPGERVRIHAPGRITAPAAGRIVSAGADTIRLEVDPSGAGVLTLPRTGVERIDHSLGRPYLRNAAIGAGAGLLLGGTLAALSFGELGDHESYTEFFGFLIGGATGAVVGGLSGVIVTDEGWRTGRAANGSVAAGSATLLLRPDVRVRVTPVHGPRVGGRTLAAADGMRLRADGRDHTWAWHELARVEARGGRDRLRGVAWGTSLLGGLALIAGGIDYSRGELDGGEYVGAIVGNGVIGAGLGYLLAPRGWIELPLPRTGATPSD